MMRPAKDSAEAAVHSWRNPWLRGSVLAVLGMVVASLLVGFVWLPSVQSDFGAQGLWASICRAAGVAGDWGGSRTTPSTAERTTGVVLTRAMAEAGGSEAVGRGATLALQCSICHGAKGLSGSAAPNLAGQYPEVILKQLVDYQHGDRLSSIMQALAQGLSDQDRKDIAAYYAYLPRTTSPALADSGAVPKLVRVGDPMRNIAPCSSCHGGIDHKLGAPWLEGMPAEYLSAQLTAFESGARKNDSHGQMRNMARRLSRAEVVALAGFYARRGPP